MLIITSEEEREGVWNKMCAGVRDWNTSQDLGLLFHFSVFLLLFNSPNIQDVVTPTEVGEKMNYAKISNHQLDIPD